MNAVINPSLSSDRSYVTIFTQNGPLGKEVDIDETTGELIKTSKHLNFGIGEVYQVPHPAAFVDLLKIVTNTNNKAFMLGYIEGTQDGKTFEVTSERDYLDRGGSKELPYIVMQDGPNVGMKLVARVLRHTVASSWILLDRDTPEGMPDDLASLTKDEWLDMMNIIAPGLVDAAKVILPSSSSRIVYNGNRAATPNFHCYIQVKNPADTRRFRDVMSQLAYDAFLTYQIDGVGKHRFIFDRTTFSEERLCYESEPVARHHSIQIAPVEVEYIAGGVLDTEKITAPNLERPGLHKAIANTTSGISGSGDNDLLRWDQPIETRAHGWITPKEFYDDPSMGNEDGKLRDCQSFNRAESVSWNGYLQRTVKGQIYFYDNGDGVGFMTLTDISQAMAGIGEISMSSGPVVAADVAGGVVQPGIVDNTALLLEHIPKVRLDNFIDAQKFIDTLVTSGISTNEQKTVLATFKKHFGNARDINAMFKGATRSIVVAERKDAVVAQVAERVATGACLSLDEELSWETFPIVKRGEEGEVVSVTTHYKNTEHLLNAYGIAIGYNQITKRPSIAHTEFNSDGREDMASEAAIGRVLAQVALNRLDGFNDATVLMHLNILTMDRQYNPVTDLLSSIQWDGVDRIPAFCALVGVDHQIKELRDYLIRKWCIQACAAADHATHTPLSLRARDPALPKFEYILVLQGAQGLQKTKFVESMLPVRLRNYFKDGVLLDPSNKDSVSLFIKNWVVELGELDASFKRSDISHLKAFMSNQRDSYRPPFGKGNVDYQRRTAVIATVNPDRFLMDVTGNRRFWALQVTDLQLSSMSEVDMDQLWGQFWHIYMSGEQWWPEDEWQGRIDQLSNKVLYLTDKQQEIADMLFYKYEDFSGDDSGWEEIPIRNIMKSIGLDRDNNGGYTGMDVGKTLSKINRSPDGDVRNRKTNGHRVWKMPKLRPISGESINMPE